MVEVFKWDSHRACVGRPRTERVRAFRADREMANLIKELDAALLFDGRIPLNRTLCEHCPRRVRVGGAGDAPFVVVGTKDLSISPR